MEPWTGCQGVSALHNKFWTLPGRHTSHIYKEKQHRPRLQQQQCEKDVGRKPDWWAVPGSRMGGVLQDYINWTDQPTSCFSGTLSYQPHPKAISEFPEQVRRWEQTEMGDTQEQINYDRGQRHGWEKRWRPSRTPDDRSDGKRGLSAASYRELEAWAARYYHSLPRRRRMEAEPWGASNGQAVQDGMSAAGGMYSQSTFHSSEQHSYIRGSVQRSDRQSAAPHTLPQSYIAEKSLWKDRKENYPSFQERVFKQPPQYIPPPPYTAAHPVPQPQTYDVKDTSQLSKKGNQDHDPNFKYFTLPAIRKQDIHGVLQKNKKDDEERERLHLDSKPEQADKRTWAHLDLPKYADSKTEPVALLSSQSPAKAKQKKKFGGETIFCLVSRPGGVAGLSASPREPMQPSSLQLLTASPLDNTEASVPGTFRKDIWVEDDRHCQLADVDTGGRQFEQQRYPSVCSFPGQNLKQQDFSPRLCDVPVQPQNKQETLFRKELVKAVQGRLKFPEMEAESPAYKDVLLAAGSKTLKTLSPAFTKFPLWKKPSHVVQATSSTTLNFNMGSLVEEDNLQEEDNLCKNQDEKKIEGSDFLTQQSEKGITKHNEDAGPESNNGFLLIDATCVVVKAEFIPPPKKEYVQYIYSPHGNDMDVKQNESHAVSQSDLDSPPNFSMQESLEESQMKGTDSEEQNKCKESLASDVDTESELPYGIGNIERQDVNCASLLLSEVSGHESSDNGILKDSNQQEAQSNESPMHVLTGDISVDQGFSVKIRVTELEASATKVSEPIKYVTSIEETEFNSGDQMLMDLGNCTDPLPKQSTGQLDYTKQSKLYLSDKDLTVNYTEKLGTFVPDNHEGHFLISQMHQDMSSQQDNILLSLSSPPCFHPEAKYGDSLHQLSSSLTDSVSDSCLLSDISKISDLDLKVNTNNEDKSTHTDQSIYDCSDTDKNVDQTEKHDMTASETIRNEDPLSSCCTDQLTCSQPGNILLSAPSPCLRLEAKCVDCPPESPCSSLDPIDSVLTGLSANNNFLIPLDRTADLETKMKSCKEESSNVDQLNQGPSDTNEIVDIADEHAIHPSPNICGEEPSQSTCTALYPVDSLAWTDSNVSEQIFTDKGKAADLEQKMGASSEEALNYSDLSIQGLSNEGVELTEKSDIFITETTCNTEAVASSHTNQEISNQPGDTALLSPSFPHLPHLDCLPESPSSPTYPALPQSSSLPVATLQSPSHELMQLSSISDLVTSPLLYTASCLASESPSDFVTSLSLITAQDTDLLSSPHVGSTLSSPLCHPVTVSTNQDEETHISSPTPRRLVKHQFPSTLWDAVNRIRRHTAPDSENEEEEGGEVWDMSGEGKQAARELVSVREIEDWGGQKIMFRNQEIVDMVDSEKSGCMRDQSRDRISAVENADKDGVSAVLTCVSHQKSLESLEIEQDDDELEGQIEDDTLSCSSSDSHTSRDTVIMGQDGELQDMDDETKPEFGNCMSWTKSDINETVQVDCMSKGEIQKVTEELLSECKEQWKVQSETEVKVRSGSNLNLKIKNEAECVLAHVDTSSENNHLELDASVRCCSDTNDTEGSQGTEPVEENRIVDDAGITEKTSPPL